MKTLQEIFSKWKELVISTSSLKWEPHSVIAISIWIIWERLVIANCQMKKTVENLKNNPQVSIISWYFRLKWEVKIFDEWKYFEICEKENTWTWYTPKNAIVVTIKEVINLDTWEKIF